MQQNNQVIVDGKVVDNEWQLITDANAQIPEGKVIVPLAVFISNSSLKDRKDLGVWLSNETDLSDLNQDVFNLPLIAIDFPAFMDGRGFSLARLLRERYLFEGEIRAIGHVIRDQLCYLKRCGFNAFNLGDDVDINAALASLTDFTEAYQTSVDQPEPLFRRR